MGNSTFSFSVLKLGFISSHFVLKQYDNYPQSVVKNVQGEETPPQLVSLLPVNQKRRKQNKTCWEEGLVFTEALKWSLISHSEILLFLAHSLEDHSASFAYILLLFIVLP